MPDLETTSILDREQIAFKFALSVVSVSILLIDKLTSCSLLNSSCPGSMDSSSALFDPLLPLFRLALLELFEFSSGVIVHE
ncbi:hypothetical protein BpHYR1_041810 [Brachionus plicatilis]|uniref:Uncharacterized protein n=1 Tax=Brachionus plicatilis TaxID=10195 RepID=A0A3M7RB62_BRAPC|nr:hypothetical protein BpHYR1_041810 [Brachionus plicatilis]